MKITKKQLMKMIRKARREADTRYSPTVVHKTSKKDKVSKTKNTLNLREIGDF